MTAVSPVTPFVNFERSVYNPTRYCDIFAKKSKCGGRYDATKDKRVALAK